MCCINYSSESTATSNFCLKLPSKRQNILVPRLVRWRRLRKVGIRKRNGVLVMQMNNLKLYMENQSIKQENERLRKKALLLHYENQTLSAKLATS